MEEYAWIRSVKIEIYRMDVTQTKSAIHLNTAKRSTSVKIVLYHLTL